MNSMNSTVHMEYPLWSSSARALQEDEVHEPGLPSSDEHHMSIDSVTTAEHVVR